MNRSLAILLAVVALDAMGLGLVMPVLPALLRELAPSTPVAGHYGALLALYALMQVVFAPLLGHLSDRHGRRPVLLASLAGAAVDYAIMAAAPVLPVLYVGRIVSGITGATGAVAASGIADMTSEHERARWFGFMGAAFGGGMIAGPALGGLVGGLLLHAPFVAAAGLNLLGFLLASLLLRESRRGRGGAEAISLNPLAALRMGGALTGLSGGLAGLVAVYFVIQSIGQAPGSLWVIYGEDRFHWNAAAVGLSLAAFGAMHALAQAFVTGPLAERFGERRALLVGMAADGAGFLLLAFATRNWMMAPILVLLATGGVGMTALQAMLSRSMPEDRQGALQGMLTSLGNLSSVIGPLAFTAIYAATARAWNGWVWIIAAALYLICLPALVRANGEGR